VNIEQLRHALKVKWLLYYRQNRPWITKLRIWGTFEGKRRPSSSFVVATMINLEPQLIQILPFIISLNSNPDQIVVALGLDFNPEEELKSLTQAPSVVETHTNGNVPLPTPIVKTHTNGNVPLPTPIVKTHTNGNSGNGNGLSKQILPKSNSEGSLSPETQASNLSSWVDEACQGVGWNRDR
jgi:hypothetical protein